MNTDSDKRGAADIDAPLCAAFDPSPRTPRITLPALACDSHAHICGPKVRYAYSHNRIFTPPDSLLSDYQHMLKTLGLERAVLVQPSVYEADNTVMLEALKEAGSDFRGVAVIDDDISEHDLEYMHETGVRGVRFNIVDVKKREPGTLPLEQLKRIAQRVKPFNWHLELLLHADEFPDLDRTFDKFPVDVVFGHLGFVKCDRGTEDPGFQALLRLMKAGKAWVKLTGPYRISEESEAPYADTNAFAHSLIEGAPDRVLWGSDWPHVKVKKPMPNDGDLCDLLADWIPDEVIRRQVLVDNPARLYGF